MLGLLVLAARSFAATDSSLWRDAAWAVFAPDIAADSGDQRLSKLLGLGSPPSLVIMRARGFAPTVISIRGAFQTDAAEASPTFGLAAARILRMREVSDRGREYLSAVAVVDTLGNEMAFFPEAHGFQWSPDGSKLALRFATYRPDGKDPSPDSVGIWDARTRELRIHEFCPYGFGWLTNETILVFFGDRVDAVDIGSGAVRPTEFLGTNASPDTSYSLTFGGEGDGVHVWDEQKHVDITEAIEGLLDGGDVRHSSVPFWVPRMAGTLCLSSCRYRDSKRNPTSGATECSVYVIDLQRMSVLARIPGKGIGKTADGTGMVILRGGQVHFARVGEEESTSEH